MEYAWISGNNNKKGVAWIHNYPHSVHIICTNHRKIDAHEVRDVEICNIPGAFLSADMYKDVKMAVHGRLAEIMVNISPQIYIHHTIYDKGRPVLYVTLNKALYGCLRSALLLYEWLVADMRGKGF